MVRILYFWQRTSLFSIKQRRNPKNIVCEVLSRMNFSALIIFTLRKDLQDNRSHTTPRLYADDTQIFAKNSGAFFLKLNSDLANISQWLMSNKLQYYSTKTKLMFVGSKHNLNKINCDLPVMQNNQPISRVYLIPCLGVTLDETVSWNDHIQLIYEKVGAGIGMLKRIKPCVPFNMLQSIYNAVIQPYFDNYSPIGGTCNKTLNCKGSKTKQRE